MPKLFRERPPIDLVNSLLQTCGLQSSNDNSWFCKHHIQIQKFDELLPELEPFYIPCKAEEYLHVSLTYNRAITILRQVLRMYNIQLLSKEMTRNQDKTLWYQLQQPPTLLQQEQKEVLIEFT